MYLVQRAHRASICSHSSMLQCLRWSLEGTLPEAESIKWSSSNRRLSCDTCTQNRSSVCLGSLKITSENFSWNQLANRLFTLTSLFAQAWAREWNHNVWSAKLPSQCGLLSKRALCGSSPTSNCCCSTLFLSPGTVSVRDLFVYATQDVLCGVSTLEQSSWTYFKSAKPQRKHLFLISAK